MAIQTNIKKDTEGLAWVWIVALVSIFFCPFANWMFGVPYQAMVDAVTAGYTFTGSVKFVFDFMQIMVSYLLTFALFGILFWAVVQSKARSYNA